MFPPIAAPSAPPARPPRRKVADPATLTPVAPDLPSLITQEATRAGLRPDLLSRVIQQESGGNPRAVSPKGAIGLGQLMPGTAKDLGVNPQMPTENVRGAATYLRQMLDQFGGDETKALAAYNAGPGAVQKAGGVPNYPETQGYVSAIQGGGAAPRRKVADPTTVQPLQAPAAAVPGATPAVPGGATVAAGPPPAPPGPPQDMKYAHPLAQLGYGLLDTATGMLTRPKDTAWNAAVAAGQTLLNAGHTAYNAVAPYVNTGPAIRSTARTVLPAAGTIGGSVLGGAEGGWQGALGGATTGAALGEGASMGVEALTGAPPAAEDVMGRLLGAGATGATSELTGQAITGAAGKLMRPIAGKLTDVGKEAIAKYGPIFTPAQVTTSRGANIAENVAKGALFGGGKMNELHAAQDALFEGERKRIIQSFTGVKGVNTPERVGQIFQIARDAGLKRFSDKAAQQYADVETKAAGAQIPLEDLTAFAKKELGDRIDWSGRNTGTAMLQQLAKQGEAGAAPPGAPPDLAMPSLQDPNRAEAVRHIQQLLSDAGLLPGGAAKELPSSLSYKQAQHLRSDLVFQINSLEGAAGGRSDPLVGVSKQLLKRLDQSIDANLPPEAQVAFRKANADYAAGKAKFDSDFLRKLADEHPEYVVDRIVQPGSVTDIRNARNAVEPRQWRRVQALAVERMLTNEEGQTATGSTITKRINKLTEPTLTELFPGASGDEVHQFARILEQVQQNKEGTGKMWIALTQAGALSKIASGGTPGMIARNTLVVPWTISKLFASPLGRKWLTTGFEAPQGSAAFTKAGLEASAFLAREALHEGQSEAYKQAWKDQAPPGAPPSALAGGPPGPPR